MIWSFCIPALALSWCCVVTNPPRVAMLRPDLGFDDSEYRVSDSYTTNALPFRTAGSDLRRILKREWKCSEDRRFFAHTSKSRIRGRI